MFDSDLAWQSTLALLTRARAGDQEALNDLFARYVPVLNRWARGRLPVAARDLADTSDLVQDTLIQVFKRLDAFDHRGEGALLAYLRQAVMNRIRNEVAERPPAAGARGNRGCRVQIERRSVADRSRDWQRGHRAVTRRP